MGAGHSVTALYEVELARQAANQSGGTILTVQVRYADTLDGKIKELSKSVSLSDFTPNLETTSPHFRLALAAAGFARQIRSGSPAHYPQRDLVLNLARQAAAALPQDSDVQEMARLVEKATSIR